MTQGRTVLVGDMGGHLDVFEQILADLRIGSDNVVPDGLTVINVGDLVRADSRYRESNTSIVRRVYKIIAVNGPEKWVQLIGNHECAALSGISRPSWDLEQAFAPECIDMLVEMWQEGTLKLSSSVDGYLITHAGLTRGYWELIGKPDNALSAEKILNDFSGRDIVTFANPGRLVTHSINESADTMWAEVNVELLTPWMESQDMPFSQIHGHASPFHWSEGEWWGDASSEIRELTVADSSFRRSVTTLARGQTITSIDWNLEDYPPEAPWPLLQMGESSSTLDASEISRLRDEPGVLFSLSKELSNSNSPDHFSLIGGTRARSALWESRLESVFDNYLASVHTLKYGDESLFERFKATDWGDKKYSFELDLSLVSTADERTDEIPLLLCNYLPPEVCEFIQSLPPIDVSAVNQNRQLLNATFYRDLGVRVLDIPINTLPATRRRSRNMVLLTRWVRVILLPNGIVSLWYPCAHPSCSNERVPWPHSGVPSRSKKNLQRILTESISSDLRQELWFEDLIVHENYFVHSWFSEIEFWQDAAFEWLTKSLTLDDVEVLRGDLGLLSQYAQSVRWTQRAIERRTTEEEIGEAYPQVAQALVDFSLELKEILPMMRGNLKESFDILSTVSQRVQEDSSKKAQETSERLNWLITLFTAVLFVPTIVSGIYGANIDVLSEGARGTISELLAWMLGSAFLSYGLLNAVTGKRKESILGTISGVGVLFGAILPYFAPQFVFSVPLYILFSLMFLLGTVWNPIKNKAGNG